MSYLRFNRFYVIESLIPEEGDTLTGTKLMEDLKPTCESLRCLTSGLFTVNSLEQWEVTMQNILDNTDKDNIPLLHFEIHGSDDKSGLYLNNGDIVSWSNLLGWLSRINQKSRCNLFVTFAVCYSLHIFEYVNIYGLMPFCGTIGTLDEQEETDLYLKYKGFYQEFLTSLDIDKAFEVLKATNPDAEYDYKHMRADWVFNVAQYGYLTKDCTRTALKLRAEKTIADKHLVFKDKADKRKFIKDFRNQEHIHREDHYLECLENYYMFKVYPENQNRFLYYNTTTELLEAFK